jgi:hypothetical protein
MIKRPSQQESSDFDKWNMYDRRDPARLYDWAGEDRRNQVVEHITIHEKETTPDSSIQTSAIFARVLTNGSVVSIVFALMSVAAGFIFNLYNNTRDIDFKQKALTEKIDDQKKSIDEINGVLKEIEKDKKAIDAHLYSIEETMIQLYHSKNK